MKALLTIAFPALLCIADSIAAQTTAANGTADARKGVSVYERQTSPEEPSGVISIDYNSAAHRGGSWEYGAHFAYPFTESFSASVFGRVFPHGENDFHEDKVFWQTGLRLEMVLWSSGGASAAPVTVPAGQKPSVCESCGDAAISLFGGVAGPSLVSQQGVDLEAGLQGYFPLSERLDMFATVGTTYTTVPLDHTRDAFAFADVELDYGTRWLPNESDSLFVSCYFETGEIRDEGVFVQVSAGIRFSIGWGFDIEARVGTEIESPYDEKEDVFVQTGISYDF
ncbi:MAG: hypothetical protein JNM99_22380 [Verrucomicrobiaceae bacterium]|nr:hypothetical protein [Verrucomicrobiaceae bacterium]